MDTNDKSKLFSIWENLKEAKTQVDKNGLSNSTRRKVLLVDGYNTFLRCFAAIPSMNEDGLHTGGISGFLKSMGYAIKMCKPDRCVVIFDGPGGSLKRRKIFPDYKQRRKTKIRLNRAYANDDDGLNDEDRNLKKQLQRTVEYLQNIPVNMLSLDNVEADDTIAYCATDHFKEWDICIMSSDKDFLQLVTERISVWSPTKKKLYGPSEVINEYGIHSNNFTLYRALDGDVSDNIPGIKGCGLKTLLKAFPELREGKTLLPVDLFVLCEKAENDWKIYENILNDKNGVERNYELMQLHNTQLQTFAQLHVKDSLDNPITKLNRFEFSKLVTEDKLWNNIPNYQTWIGECFTKLDGYIKE
jgi:5'-3' exonuclease